MYRWRRPPLLATLMALPAGLGCSLLQDVDSLLCPEDDPSCETVGSGGLGGAEGTGGDDGSGGSGGEASTGGNESSGGGEATGGQGSMGGAPPVDCPAPGSIEVEYQNGQVQGDEEGEDRIRPHFRLKNLSNESVEFKDLVLRYYFSADGAAGINFQCIYGFAVNGCRGAVTGLALPPELPEYMEVKFTADAGVILPEQTSAFIKGQIRHTSGNAFNQENDYSYSADPAFTGQDYSTWEKITLHCGDLVIWGDVPE